MGAQRSPCQNFSVRNGFVNTTCAGFRVWSLLGTTPSQNRFLYRRFGGTCCHLLQGAIAGCVHRSCFTVGFVCG
jgi:hypothetical protein